MLGCAACGFSVRSDAVPTDASSDAPGDGGSGGEGGDASFCYGAGFGAVCLSAAPASPLVLPSDPGFDTGGGGCTEIVSSQGIELCVMAGTTVSLPVGRTFRGLGARPLVVVAVDTMTIDGFLGVSSLIGSQPGAGSGFAPCSGATAGVDDAGGASGGAGGSFGGRGGTGGSGDLDATPSLGGVAAPTVVPTNIRAGCPGTSGGTGDSAGGAGGPGGGALYLIAGTQITINGGLYSVGRGGGGAMSRGGGGGGGSGGLIGLDAPTVHIVGTIAANGGGGGEGARVQVETGFDGSDGLVGARAPGGDDSDPLDGAGGDGSEGATLAGGPGIGADGGGGGGGGGAGFVYLKGARTGTGPVSPAAAVVP